MSAAVKTTSTPHTPPAPTRLEATAQLLDFEPGLYSVEISCAETTHLRDGLVLPFIQLEPVATPSGRAHISTLSAFDQIMPGAHPAYLRVEGSRASVLLTIYKAHGAKMAPDLRVRLIGRAEAPAPVPQTPPLPSLPLVLLAHVERDGDVTAGGGLFVGKSGNGGAVEGFAITPGAPLTPADIEYQAVLGSDWSTPWVTGGNFCGSRGLALPLLGIRIRLVGEAAKTHRCAYWGSFEGGHDIGPLTDGAACAADGAPLEALRVVITPAPSVAPLGPPGKPILKAPKLPPAPAKPKHVVKRPVMTEEKTRPRRR